jgi:SAM-dependent methyltransferase
MIRSLRGMRRAVERPEPFARSANFWSDRYVRRHLLNAHLDPECDDASRRPETIERSTTWIDGEFRPKESPLPRHLDLGCGPGLYTLALARRGWETTGIDLSPTSIRYARHEAAEAGLRGRCRYRVADITGPTIDRDGPFDLVTMIYGVFCVLSDEERTDLLSRVARILRPEGRLVFDAFTRRYLATHRIPRDWYYARRNGFWHPTPHLVFEETVEYEPDLILNRYTVLPSFGRIRSWHVWHRAFDHDRIETLLEKSGFRVTGLYGDLAGSPFDPDGEWIGVAASLT